MNKGNSKKSIFLSAAMLTIMVLGMGSSVLIFQQTRLRYAETPEAHMLFNMGQYEFELLRTTEALIDLTHHPEDKQIQAKFEKWFNILWSRTSVLDQGEVGARMAFDGFDLTAVKKDMAEIDQLLFQGKENTTKQLIHVRSLFRGMSDASHRFIIKREYINRRIDAEQWKTVFASFRNSIILGVVSFVLGLFVVYLLFRNNMKLMNLRGSLEVRVHKRTEELQLSNSSLKREITERYKAESELKKSQAAAEDANKAKSEFLAIMSHEIRTPLAGIIGMSELLLNSSLNSKQLDWSESVKISGQNLLSILNDILDQSKLEFGKFDFVPTDFHLSSFIEGATELFSAKFGDKGLTKTIQFQEGLPDFVNADSLRFGQVLSNLLSNALKFTNDGGITINVTGEKTSPDEIIVKVEVRDTGIGFSPEIQRQLFTSFQQGDSSTSRMYGGTGLGLSISKQLVEAMGGGIDVESEEGKGAAFSFTIPCRIVGGHDLQKVEAVKPVKWVALRPLKILLAEDNFINQKVIVEIFRNLGHEITVAENGKVAVDYIRDESFDLVLMDIRMPEMDGLEATKIIRSMKDDKSIVPIIAVTADIAAGSIEKFFGAGMNDVCPKPLELPKLLVAINTCLEEDVYVLGERHTDVKIGNETLIAHDMDDKALKISDFQSVIETIEELLESHDNDTKTEILSIEGIDAETTALLASQYEEMLEVQCIELKASFENLSSDPNNYQLWNELSKLLHSLKGDGGTYGYPLVSMIARGAEEIIRDTEDLNHTHLSILGNHVQALVLIGAKKISGTGGDAGHTLLKALKTKMI